MQEWEASAGWGLAGLTQQWNIKAPGINRFYPPEWQRDWLWCAEREGERNGARAEGDRGGKGGVRGLLCYLMKAVRRQSWRWMWSTEKLGPAVIISIFIFFFFSLCCQSTFERRVLKCITRELWKRRQIFPHCSDAKKPTKYSSTV